LKLASSALTSASTPRLHLLLVSTKLPVTVAIAIMVAVNLTDKLAIIMPKTCQLGTKEMDEGEGVHLDLAHPQLPQHPQSREDCHDRQKIDSAVFESRGGLSTRLEECVVGGRTRVCV
jgi:hypothetical protein